MGFLIHILTVSICLISAGVSSVKAAEPRLEPLLRTGRWPNESNSIVIDAAVQGNYVFLASRFEGLKIIDVSDPSNPVLAGEHDTSGDALGVAVEGNYAFIADGHSGLEVINISNPAHTIRAGGCLLPSFGLGTNGYATDITVAGNLAYVADSGAPFGPPLFGGLHVIDLKTFTNCLPVGKCATTEAPGNVQVSGKFAYVGTRGGMEVVDISDPSIPVSVAFHPTVGYAGSVAVSGHRAYLWRDQWLRILDISNPTNIIHLNTVTVHDDKIADSGEVAVVGNYALMASDYLGVRVFDVSNPTNCTFVTGFATGGGQTTYTINVAEGRIYVGDYSGKFRVFSTIPGLQFAMQIHAEPNVPLTLEGTTNLTYPIAWTQLVTTNVSTNKFNYTDLDGRSPNGTQKYYRVVQR